MRKNLLSKVFGVVAALTMATSATAGTASAWNTVDKYGNVIYPPHIKQGGYYGRYYRNVDPGEWHCEGIQLMLTFSGYPTAIDGILGKNSDAAIRNFQSKKRIAVDGIVGKDTYKKLVYSSGVVRY